MRSLCGVLLVCALTASAAAASVADVLREAQAAAADLDSQRALELYLRAEAMQPGDVVILQQIARQYSDLVLDQKTDADRHRQAQAALEYARKAEALDPRNAVSALSVAIAYGKLANASEVGTKVRYARAVKEAAERAVALDPNYAWAHHILGRWHREVGAIGIAARGVAKLFYGGLPPASVAEAVAHLQRAVELEPGELNHRLELGFALAAAGRDKEARQAWERGLGMPSRNKHDDVAKQAARAALAGLG